MRYLITAVLLLGACGGAASLDSGIRGTVRAGPACPGPARQGSPCPDRPVRMTIEVVQGQTVVATVTTDDAGTFTVAVAPGNYAVRSKTGLPSLRATAVTVGAGTYTDVQLEADTGIR